MNPGQVIDTPTVGSNEILVARFTPAPDGVLSSLEHTVLKDWSPLMVTADGNEFRLPKALADGPLMVSVPAALGGAQLFNGLQYNRLSFNRPGTLEFQAITVR